MTYLHFHFSYIFYLDFVPYIFSFHLLYHTQILQLTLFYILIICLFIPMKLFLRILISSCLLYLRFSSNSCFYSENYFYFYLLQYFLMNPFFSCLNVLSIIWIYLISFLILCSWFLKSRRIEDWEQSECILLIIDILRKVNLYFTI